MIWVVEMTEFNVGHVAMTTLNWGLSHLIPEFDLGFVALLSNLWLKTLHELVAAKHVPVRLYAYLIEHGVVVLH